MRKYCKTIQFPERKKRTKFQGVVFDFDAWS